jgi:hypothetical protein
VNPFPFPADNLFGIGWELTDYSGKALSDNIFLPDRFHLSEWSENHFFAGGCFWTGGSYSDCFHFNGIVDEVVRLLSIDIKPGVKSNGINLKGKGKIPVAIVSSRGFDATKMVYQESLTFGRKGNEDSLAFCNFRGQDINGDRLKDLVCHFYAEDTGFQCCDTEGILKGITKDGVPIEGRDFIRTNPCKNRLENH